jgi:hypothetical protein
MNGTLCALTLSSAITVAACAEGSSAGGEQLPESGNSSAVGDAIVAMRDQSEPLRVGAKTKFSVEVKFDPRIARALAAPEGDRIAYGNRVIDVLAEAFPRRTGGPSRIEPSGTIKDDGINILVLQRIEPNDRGDPYNMVLEARQGGRLWRRTAERGTGRERPDIGRPIAGEEGPLMTLNQRLQASLSLDATDLARALVKNLENGN